MARWQRYARIVLGLVIIAVPIAVAIALHKRAAPAPGSMAPPHVEPNALVAIEKGVYTQIQGARETFSIHYQSQVTFSDGSTRLSGVTIKVDHRGGRNFVVKGDQAQVGNNNSRIVLTGHVRVQVSDGLRLDTTRLIYTKGDGMARSKDRVTFSRGGMTGSAIGATYDNNNDILSLVKDAVIHIAPDAHGQNGADIRAESIEFVRRQHMLIFRGGVRLVRGAETVEADNGTAYLTDDEKALSGLSLRSHSRITNTSSVAGGLRGMQARDIDLQYRPDGGTIQQATLTGGATIAMAGPTAREDRQIAADELTMQMAPDGSTVTSLNGKRKVTLTFPPVGDTPGRTIRADTIVASDGGTGGGLTAATLAGQVDYRERLKGGDRLARAGQLELALAPGLGDLHTATFSRDVRITQNEMQALAATARYDVAAGTMALSGAGPDKGPHVVDDHIIVDATSIALTPDGPSLEATDHVRSVLKPAAQGGQRAGQPATRMPAILKSDQPVNVTSDKLVYDGPAAHAVYTGQARLWQADTTIQGDEIVLDDRTGNLTSTGSVRTTMLVNQQDQKTKQTKREPVIAQAQNLQYDDDTKCATYTVGAHLNGPDGDLTSDKIELYLTDTGDEVKRLEGYQAIDLKQPGRIVTGDRLSYFAVDERYLVTGAPVKINEECRETLGKTLTFWKSTDRIVVDGGREYRTETRGGNNCSGPRDD
jgi:LPS export ABC transporter protein LptC/lipopolysaccharide transport protein LptA